VAQAEMLVTNEDAEAISGSLDATDVDGEELTFALNGDIPTGLTFNADGTYTFDPSSYQYLDDGETFEVEIPYTVTDGSSTTGSTFTIKVTGTNDAPVVSDAQHSTNDGTVTFDLSDFNAGGAADVEDDNNADDFTLIKIESLPEHGTLYDSDGNEINIGDTFTDVSDITYVADDGYTSAILMGTKENSGSQGQWGENESGQIVFEASNGLEATVSGYNQNGQQINVGFNNSINNQKGLGLGVQGGDNGQIDTGEKLSIQFNNTVTNAIIGLGGLGNHFIEGSTQGAEAHWEAYKNGELVDSGFVYKPDGNSFTQEIDLGGIEFDQLVFYNEANVNSNFVVQYVEATNVLNDSFEYSAIDSDGTPSVENAVVEFDLDRGSDVITANLSPDAVNDTDSVREAGHEDGTTALPEPTAEAEITEASVPGNNSDLDLSGYSECDFGDLNWGQTIIGNYASNYIKVGDIGGNNIYSKGGNDIIFIGGDVNYDCGIYGGSGNDVLVLNKDRSDYTIVNYSVVNGHISAHIQDNDTGKWLNVSDLEDIRFGGFTDGSTEFEVDITPSTDEVPIDGYVLTVVNATLSDGTNNGDGTWTVTADELEGLKAFPEGDGDVSVEVAEVLFDPADLGTTTPGGAIGDSVAQGNVLDNDTDPENDSLTVESAEGKTVIEDGIQIEGEYGVLTIKADGSYTYELNDSNSDVNALQDGETLYDTFDYTASDGNKTDDAQLKITINGTNDNPVAQAETIEAVEAGDIIYGQLDASDVDNTSDELTFTLNGDAPAGFTLDSDGGYIFDPNNSAYTSLGSGETITVQAEYTVSDGKGGLAVNNITITVTGGNEAPEISVGSVVTDVYYESETAGFDNIVGVYQVDDQGNPVSGQIILLNNNDSSLEANELLSSFNGVDSSQLKFFIIADGFDAHGDISDSEITFDNSGDYPKLLIDGNEASKPVYYSDSEFNSDGVAHFFYSTDENGNTIVSMEDLPASSSDNDRTDVVLRLETRTEGTTTTYTTISTDGEAVALAPEDIEISDVDDINIEDAKIVLTNTLNGDDFDIGTLPDGITYQKYTDSDGNLVVELDGSASLDSYEAAIKQIKFNNDSDDIDDSTREIEITVNDGDADSNVYKVNIDMENSPEGPVEIGDLLGDVTFSAFKGHTYANANSLKDTGAGNADLVTDGEYYAVDGYGNYDRDDDDSDDITEGAGIETQEALVIHLDGEVDSFSAHLKGETGYSTYHLYDADQKEVGEGYVYWSTDRDGNFEVSSDTPFSYIAFDGGNRGDTSFYVKPLTAVGEVNGEKVMSIIGEVDDDELDFSNMENIRAIQMDDDNEQEIELSINDVLDMAGDDKVLQINLGEGDSVELEGEWSDNGSGIFTNTSNDVQIEIIGTYDSSLDDNNTKIFTDDGTEID
jgi:VCBS repeat-containing protein